MGKPGFKRIARSSQGQLALCITLLGALSSCARDPEARDPDAASGGPSEAPDKSSDNDEGPPKSGSDPSGSDDAKSPSASDESDAGSADSESPDEGGPKFDLGAIPDGKAQDGDDCECQPGAELIFLWGNSGTLWTYDPTKTGDEAFKNLGKPDCPTPPRQFPFSMGVDRHSNAWLLARPSGVFLKVDTRNNNECVDSGFVPGTEGFTLFGMAYVEHPNDGVCEQLYMHSFEGEEASEGPNAGSLGTMDPETLKVQRIGSINFNGGEMTGTADGRLFAFAGIPGRLFEYDPKTAKVLKEVPLGGLELTSSFAFAFWGGDFYFFTDTQDGLLQRSKVTKLDYDGDGSLRTVVEAAPVRVAGAGVSICAPLEEPPG